jgi:nicotinamidase-related amidase
MENTLLLIVDVQNAIADQKPYLFEEVISNIRLLLEVSRQFHKPVIFIQHDDGIGSELEINSRGWEIVKEIAPLPGERVIPKRFNSAFRETSLEKELNEMKIKKLIIVGLQTEFCIDTTIRVAFEKGFEVILPENTHSTIDGKFLSAREIIMHHNHLFNNRFGRIVKMDEVVNNLRNSH